ncbi:hypothetical protein [Haloarchaeobius sp. HME9146]|uniref:hypothetical protein n=1 Tax=Haloarchaeobius sp. HME9146 TaxID=2978732 RepID=UPI0021BF0C63|nr:hypothetical protein [Haloarchaeobius sp. HME9146]MCT9095168.1 hypothetical protein [Haloarchaeobius sp. HME9146]
MHSNYSTYRHVKLLRHVLTIAKRVGSINTALIEKPDAEAIVRWINRGYNTEEINQDYRVALKVFGCRVTDDGVGGDPDEPPASLNWIPSSTSRNYDPAPKPGNMLDWNKDVIPMIEPTKQGAMPLLLHSSSTLGFMGSSSATSPSGTSRTTNTDSG